MKKLLLLIVFVLPIVFSTFGQVEDVDAQLFGSRRTTKKYNIHDFGSITEVVQHEFIVKNTSLTPMTIVSFKAPEGFEVVIPESNIKPQSVVTITVIVDPEKVNIQGYFEEKIIITTEYEDALGLKTKEMQYTVKGNL